jgi:hypothetical protein
MRPSTSSPPQSTLLKRHSTLSLSLSLSLSENFVASHVTLRESVSSCLPLSMSLFFLSVPTVCTSFEIPLPLSFPSITPDLKTFPQEC